MSTTTFAVLLRDTPASDAEITAFLRAQQTVLPDRCAPAGRAELEAGLLWLHTLSADEEIDVAMVVSLPPRKKKATASLLQIQGPDIEPVAGWPKLAIRRAHASSTTLRSLPFENCAAILWLNDNEGSSSSGQNWSFHELFFPRAGACTCDHGIIKMQPLAH